MGAMDLDRSSPTDKARVGYLWLLGLESGLEGVEEEGSGCRGQGAKRHEGRCVRGGVVLFFLKRYLQNEGWKKEEWRVTNKEVEIRRGSDE